MVLWFLGGSVVVVWMVFRDTAIDYRLVAGGALLPDVVDGAWGGARLLHTLVASAIVLGLVMVATQGRRGLRRRVLAVPIGMFLHLVLDGAWTRTAVFWWPGFGTSFDGAALPSTARPVGVVLAQEVAGALALWWGWRRFRLSEPARRRAFVRTGRLGRDLGAAPPRSGPAA